MTFAPPRLDPQPWMTAPETRAVMAALSSPGREPRFVGGCVRNALLGCPVKDVDIATPEPPERVMALLQQAGIKALPTGLKHGTVTAVCHHHPFEITTLRVDVQTDGRHAQVAFTDCWRSDAARRDLTMNALSCDSEGWVYDYFGGYDDLRARRVRFVGDAEKRIEEDGLRLLRFFRFLAHYGHHGDLTALRACIRRLDMLARLSIERVSTELLRLLEAPDPLPSLILMAACGVLDRLLPEWENPENPESGRRRDRKNLWAALPWAEAEANAEETGALPLAALPPLCPPELRLLQALVGIETRPEIQALEAGPDPERRLAALFLGGCGERPQPGAKHNAAAKGLGERLRLSNQKQHRLAALAALPTPLTPALPAQEWHALQYHWGAALFRDRILMAWAVQKTPARQYAAAADADATDDQAWLSLLTKAFTWTPPPFPLRGEDAIAAGLPKGKAVGRALRHVQEWWIAEDFIPDRAACLTRLHGHAAQER